MDKRTEEIKKRVTNTTIKTITEVDSLELFLFQEERAQLRHDEWKKVNDQVVKVGTTALKVYERLAKVLEKIEKKLK